MLAVLVDHDMCGGQLDRRRSTAVPCSHAPMPPDAARRGNGMLVGLQDAVAVRIPFMHGSHRRNRDLPRRHVANPTDLLRRRAGVTVGASAMMRLQFRHQGIGCLLSIAQP